jgi:futalosine hydrolase
MGRSISFCRLEDDLQQSKGAKHMNSDHAETSFHTTFTRPESGLRVLVVTAVSAERDAVLRGLHGDTRFDVLVAGVGSVAAAVRTAQVLATVEYDLVVSAGIGGGFPDRAEVGSLVVANEIVAADLGAETPEGFSSLDELGFGSTRVPVDAGLVKRVTEALLAAKLPVHTGSVLTVSTVTGTAETAAELAARVPGATAEAMEGYGVALAAQDRGIPILEIRAISNPVGPRDRTAWRIKEALDALEAASSVFLEVL